MFFKDGVFRGAPPAKVGEAKGYSSPSTMRRSRSAQSSNAFSARLVFRAVVRLDRLGHAFELDDHDALLDAGLVGLRRVAAGDIARAVFRERRPASLA